MWVLSGWTTGNDFKEKMKEVENLGNPIIAKISTKVKGGGDGLSRVSVKLFCYSI